MKDITELKRARTSRAGIILRPIMLHVPTDLHDQLSCIAGAEMRSVSAQALYFIKLGVAEHKAPLPTPQQPEPK